MYTKRKLFDCHVHHLLPNRMSENLSSFRREFDLMGVEKEVFLSVPTDHDKKGGFTVDKTQNIKALFLKDAFAPNAYAFAGLLHKQSYSSEEEASEYFLAQAKEFWAMGYDGIKMLEGYPQLREAIPFELCSPVYDAFYAFLEENGIPVTMHVANPAYFWNAGEVNTSIRSMGRFCGEKCPSKRQLHDEVEGILKKHPKLHLTLAHYGFLVDDYAAAEHYLKDYEFTMLDTTPAYSQYLIMLEDWDRWEKFFQQFSDRIKYGTDTYANSPASYETEEQWLKIATSRPYLVRQFFETSEPFVYEGKDFRGVQMSEDILEKIYYKNAEREYGAPREINFSAMREELNRLLHDSEGLSEHDVKDLQFMLDYQKN